MSILDFSTVDIETFKLLILVQLCETLLYH